MSSNAAIGNLYITVKADGKKATQVIGEVARVFDALAEKIKKTPLEIALKAPKAIPAPKPPPAPTQTAPKPPPAPKPTAPSKPPTASRPTKAPLSAEEETLKRLQTRAKNIKTLFESGTKNTDAFRGLEQLDRIPSRVNSLQAELEKLRINLKTADEQAVVDKILADIARIKKEAADIKLVVKQEPAKVAEAGSVKGAFAQIKAEQAAAQKASDEAAKRIDDLEKRRLKGIEDAKKLSARIKAAQPTELDKAAKSTTGVLDKLKGAKVNVDATDAERQLGQLISEARTLEDLLKRLRVQTNSDDERAKIDVLLAKLRQAKDESAQLRRVTQTDPARVRTAGGAANAAKQIEAEQKAALTAQANLNRQQQRAQADAQRQADRAARAAQSQANSAARDAQRQAQQAQKALDRDARRAAKDAEREARRIAKEAEKAANSTRKSLFGSFKGVGQQFKGITNEFSSIAAAAGAARSGNYFYGIATALKAVVSAGSIATSSLKNVGNAVGAVESASGPAGAVIGVVLAGALIAVSIAAARAVVSLVQVGTQAATVAFTLKALFTTGFSSAQAIEESSLALEATLGRAAEAEKKYLVLRDRASARYDFQGLLQLDRTLLAFNVTNTETRRGLIDTLVTLGTVGGRSVEQLEFAARAFGQISAAGRPYRQDVLQLVQSLGISENVIKNLPKYANLSNEAIRKLYEDGKVSADDFFQAVFAKSGQFGPIAEKASKTFAGVINNIKDTVKTGLGDAFINNGVLERAAEFARRILTIVGSIDFAPIAKGFAAVVQGISAGFGNLTNDAGASSIKKFFEVTLPNALYKVAYLAAFVAKVFSTFFLSFAIKLNGGENGVKSFGKSALSLVNLGVRIAKAFAFVWATLKIIYAVAKSLASPLLFVRNLWTGIITAIFKLIKGDFKGAVTSIRDAVSGVFDDINPVDDIQKASKEYSDFVKQIDQAAKDASNITFEPYVAPAPTGDGITDPNSPTSTTTEDAKQKVAELRNELFDLTRRIYGLRSELEKGLLGDKGFEATREQIAQIGDRIVTILRDLGKAPVANAVDGWVRGLLKLAAVRDVIAAKLEQANKRLDDAIKARDDFAQRIKQQTLDFVNALRLEERSVETVQTFQFGGIVGYLVKSVKKSDSFVEALRKRLATVKDFTRKTQELFKRGLDKKLLEQLVAAGPEEAGTVVDQLVNSGDTVIREVNQIQKDLGRYAVKTGNEQADKFYAAGVAMAKAQAEGLKSQIAAITKVAEAIGRAIYNAIVPFAKKTAEAVAGAVGGGATGGGGGAPAKRPPKTPAPKPNPNPTNLPLIGPIVADMQRDAFLKEIMRRALVIAASINTRTQIMQALPLLYTDRQIQDERKFNMIALAKALGGTTKSEAPNDYSIDVYIGGQKIGEYVDYAVKDKYGRTAADLRTGAGPNPFLPRPGSGTPTAPSFGFN